MPFFVFDSRDVAELAAYGLRFVFELAFPFILEVRFVFPDEFPLTELVIEFIFMLLGE